MVAACKQLQQNDALNRVLTEYTNHCMLEIAGSRPEETAAREFAYAKITAARELQQWVTNHA